MTLSVKHAFVSAKGDPTDATLVRPSNWNDEHDLSCASGKVLGRATAGTGDVEELDAPAFGRGILAASDLAALAAAISAGFFTTGDLKPTLKDAAEAGWVLADDGTIGDASSSASNRANADCENLFKLLYDKFSDTKAPLLTSSGTATTRTAQTDKATAWAAHCRITLPRSVGRALGVAGAGSGLTSRSLGDTVGEETHALTEAENGPHIHANTLTDPKHKHNGNINQKDSQSAVSVGGDFIGVLKGQGETDLVATGITITNASSGSGTGHNNMQPTTFVNVLVKL